MEGGCTLSMHSRNLKTIDSRMPAMPGRGMSDFHRPGRHRVHQAQSTVICSASKGRGRDKLEKGTAVLIPLSTEKKNEREHHAARFQPGQHNIYTRPGIV